MFQRNIFLKVSARTFVDSTDFFFQCNVEPKRRFATAYSDYKVLFHSDMYVKGGTKIHADSSELSIRELQLIVKCDNWMESGPSPRFPDAASRIAA